MNSALKKTPELCPVHRQDVNAWRGIHGDETGWGPGHRIPPGINIHVVNDQVEIVKKLCTEGRGCGEASATPPGCGSVDHREDIWRC